MAYIIIMGCAIFKISKKLDNHKQVEVPNFILRKTRNSSNSISPSDFNIFSLDLVFDIHKIKVPILRLEENELRKKRFWKQT